MRQASIILEVVIGKRSFRCEFMVLNVFRDREVDDGGGGNVCVRQHVSPMSFLYKSLE